MNEHIKQNIRDILGTFKKFSHLCIYIRGCCTTSLYVNLFYGKTGQLAGYCFISLMPSIWTESEGIFVH